MDEDELQKQFTDCVYFLASPLTCKKGIECEYRHSEIARLNPRDCWYWLGGCCFNPECAFRHPPLVGITDVYGESYNPGNGPALPVEKTNVPCYFFSKGFCNKGDGCSFLHASADANNNIAWKSVPCEKKLSAGSNTGSPPVKNHLDTRQIEHTVTEEQHSQELVLESPERSECHDISDSLLLQEEHVESESDAFIDEGWLESSPGFDVLVEGDSELGYEGDVQYADPIEEYDPVYPELTNPYSEERYDVYGVGRIHGKQRESIFCRLSFQKRNIQVFNGGRGCDLREHLKKRKSIDYGISRNVDRRGRLRKTVPTKRYRQSFKNKRRPGKPHFAQQEKRRCDGMFTGPKTLDQIKQEKKRDFSGFPLSPILENKRKLG